MKDAAAYYRCSTDKQDKSIEDQRAEVLKRAAREGYRIIREYVDEAISGDDDSRPDFQRLMGDVATIHDFDAIFVWSQDRFSRSDTLDAAQYWKLLRDRNVVLFACVEGAVRFDSIQAILMACVGQHGANDYLKKLSYGTTRGIKSAAEGGYWPTGAAPFGYTIVKDGKRSRLQPSADAEHVRWLYSHFLKGDYSMREVAAHLNARGLKTTRGKPWTGHAVSLVLSNEAYTGTVVFGRTAVGKHMRLRAGEFVPASRSDGIERRPREQCIVFEGAHPAIVDRVTFDRVQQKAAGRKRSGAKPRGTCVALFGLVHCGHCGRKMWLKRSGKRMGLACHTVFAEHGAKAPECCSCVRYDQVEASAIDQVLTGYLSDRAIDTHVKAFRDYLTGQRGERAKTETALKAALAEAQRKLERAEKQLLTAPEHILPKLYKQMAELEEQQRAATAELTALGRIGSSSERAISRDMDEVRQALADARAEIQAGQDSAKIRAALATVVERIDVYTLPVAKGEKAGPHQKRCLARVAVRTKPLSWTMDAIGPKTLHFALRTSLPSALANPRELVQVFGKVKPR